MEFALPARMDEWTSFINRLQQPNAFAIIEGIPGVNAEFRIIDIYNTLSQHVTPEILANLIVLQDRVVYPIGDFLRFTAEITDPEIKENIMNLRITTYPAVAPLGVRIATQEDWIALQRLLTCPNLQLLFEKMTEALSGIPDAQTLQDFDQTVNEAFTELNQLTIRARERLRSCNFL